MKYSRGQDQKHRGDEAKQRELRGHHASIHHTKYYRIRTYRESVEEPGRTIMRLSGLVAIKFTTFTPT